MSTPVTPASATAAPRRGTQPAGGPAPVSVPRTQPVGPNAQVPVGPEAAPRAPGLPADAIEVGDPYIAADDERLFREFSVTNRRYFPFEGGFEEKKTTVTTRTYLDNPVGEPPLVIRTTLHVVTTFLCEVVRGDISSSDNDGGNGNNPGDAIVISSDSEMETLAPAPRAPGLQGRVGTHAPAHQGPTRQAAQVDMGAQACHPLVHPREAADTDVDMDAPAPRASTGKAKAKAIVIDTDSDDPDGKAKAAALRASAPYPMFRPYPDSPSENGAQSTSAIATITSPSTAPIARDACSPVAPASVAQRASGRGSSLPSNAESDASRAHRHMIISSFFPSTQAKSPVSTAATASAPSTSAPVAGPSRAGTSRRLGTVSIRPRKVPFIGPKKKPRIFDFEIDEDGNIISD